MKRLLLLLLVIAVIALPCFAQGPAKTTISDTVYAPDGSLANGSVVITNPSTFTSADGFVVSQITQINSTITNGVLSVALIPNAGSNPSGTSYVATYNINGTGYREYWVVPSSGSPIRLSAVRVLAPPAINFLNVGGTAGDAIEYVGVNGNDANDGLNIGTAKATIPAAQSALPSHGGKIDATGLGQSTYTISSTLTIGGSNVNVDLILSRNTTFNCTITNNTPCFVLLAGSDVQAVGTITYPNAGITTSASASVSDVFLNQNNIAANQVGGYVDGLFVTAPTGAVVSDAICAVQNVLQATMWRNVTCASTGAQNTVGLKIYSTGGSNIIGNPLFDNVVVDGQGNAGVRPVWIGCAASGSLTPVSCSIIGNVNFFGGLAGHPGNGGLPVVTVEASNGSGGLNAVDGIDFHGFQVESFNTADIGILDDGANSLHVYGLVATCHTNCGTDMIKLAQPAGTTLDGVEISGYDNQGGWTHAVNNMVLTKTITPARGSYSYTKSTSETNAFVWDNGSGNDLTVDPSGVKVGNLTSGNCVQAGAGGLLTTIASACGGTATLDSIGNPVAVKTFSLGANTPLTFTAPGTFNNNASSVDNFKVTIGSACPEQTLIGGAFTTNVYTSCIVTPTSGVTNGLNVGFNSLIQLNDPNNGGQFGKVEGVPESGTCWANANNTRCEDSDVMLSTSGHTGILLYGREINIEAFNASDVGAGILFDTTGSTAQSAQLPAVEVNASSKFTDGIRCDIASTTLLNNFQACVNIFEGATGANQLSQQMLFHTTTAGNVDETLGLIAGTDASNGVFLGAVNGGAAYRVYYAGNGLWFTGTQTITGCSLTVPLGGSSAGSFKAGATACTVTITPGFAASNGFACHAEDLTTTTDAMHQSAYTTTTATLTGTVVSSDLITWSCIAF